MDDEITVVKDGLSDRATTIGNMHRKIGKDRTLWFRRYPRGQTDRQTDTQTDVLVTVLRHAAAVEVKRRE